MQHIFIVYIQALKTIVMKSSYATCITPRISLSFALKASVRLRSLTHASIKLSSPIRRVCGAYFDIKSETNCGLNRKPIVWMVHQHHMLFVNNLEILKIVT
ncbi:unnamed protein product, partial [Meganyctiphanes norvegica]